VVRPVLPFIQLELVRQHLVHCKAVAALNPGVQVLIVLLGNAAVLLAAQQIGSMCW
jgi:hypothetical protein